MRKYLKFRRPVVYRILGCPGGNQTDPLPGAEILNIYSRTHGVGIIGDMNVSLSKEKGMVKIFSWKIL